MRILSAAVIVLISILTCFSQDIQYPVTIHRPIDYSFHGYTYTDPYQWLENQGDAEVKIWVENQNEISEKYLRKLANKNNSINLMNKYMVRKTRWNTHQQINFDSERESNYRLFYEDQFSTPSIFYKAFTHNRYSLLVSPRDVSADDHIMFRHLEASQDDRYLAYSYSRNGEDWLEIRIKSTTGTISPKETLRNVKFSNINWKGNGFFYKQYPNTNDISKLESPSLYYHRLFTEQDQDSLVFKISPGNDMSLRSTFEEDMFVLEVENRSKGQYSYFYYDPSDQNSGFRPLRYKVDYSMHFIDYIDGKFIMSMSISDKRRIVTFDKNDPANLSIISPEYPDAQITTYEIFKNQILIAYQNISQPYMCVIDLEGNIIKDIELPNGVSARGLSYQKATDELFFQLESYTIPPVVCKLDLITYEYSIVERTGVNFDFSDYKFQVDYFESKDGTAVPMLIIYKGEKLPKNSPFLIETYAGYGMISPPSYDPGVIYFVEQGGAFAYIFARGGGELGTNWWKSAQTVNKQITFDDVVSGTEYLIKKKMANSSKIAIKGASNGGLVAATVITQHPELYAAGIIEVAPLDMIRYEEFTVGSYWSTEYGSAADSLEFMSLSGYTPYQNLVAAEQYPPLLIITSSSDDRVPPLHSYKFAAALQGFSEQENPFILWSQKSAGHSGAATILDRLDEQAYKAAFLHEFLLN